MKTVARIAAWFLRPILRFVEWRKYKWRLEEEKVRWALVVRARNEAWKGRNLSHIGNPRAGSFAINERGSLGLVISDTAQAMETTEGHRMKVWVGIHLTDRADGIGTAWLSKDPHVVGHTEEFNRWSWRTCETAEESRRLLMFERFKEMRGGLLSGPDGLGLFCGPADAAKQCPAGWMFVDVDTMTPESFADAVAAMKKGRAEWPEKTTF